MIYLIADLHLYHKNIIDYCNRPFKSIDEQIEAIVNNWNKVVSSSDTTFILGDIDLLRPRSSKERMNKVSSIIQSLNGIKYLIKGNHDELPDEWYLDNGISWVSKYPIIYEEWYILSHYPLFVNEKLPYINIHGHVHNTQHRPECAIVCKSKYVNVSIEVIDYTPISFEKIRSYVEQCTSS